MAVYTGQTQVNKPYDPYGELTNDPFETTARIQSRYHRAGETAPPAKRASIGNLLMGALSFIDTPGNLVRGALQGGYEGSQYGGGLGGMLIGALSGAGKGALHGLSLGKSGEYYTTSEWLDRADVDNKLVKGIGGFIGDVALDPLTYVGGLGIAKSLGAGAIKGAAKKTVAKTAGSVGKRLDDALQLKKISNIGAKYTDFGKLKKSMGLEGMDDVLTEGERFFGTKGIKGMDIEKKLAEEAPKTKGLTEAVATDVKELGKRAKEFYASDILKPFKEIDAITNLSNKGFKAGLNVNTETALKLTKGDEILKTVPDISSPTMQKIRENLSELVDLDTLSPTMYNTIHHLAEVLNLDRLVISNLDMATKSDIGLWLQSASVNLSGKLSTELKHGTKGYLKRLGKVRDAGQKMMQSVDEAGRNILTVEYTNALKAVVDETGKRRFVSFMGRPLAEITPYTKGLRTSLGKSILGSADRGNRLAQIGVEIADAMSRTFTNKLPLGLRSNDTAVKRLRSAREKVIQRITDHRLASGLVSRNSMNGVLNALGQRAVTFGEKPILFNGKMIKPNDLYVYWKEGMEHTNLERAMRVQGATEEQIADAVSSNAVYKYANEIIPYIDENSDVFDYFMDLSVRTDMMNSVYKSMDTALGRTYEGTSGYVHHAYQDEMIDDLSELIRSGKGTLRSSASKAHTPSMARKFKTMADAEIEGGLTGYNNIIDLMALRQSYTARLGHRINLLEGTTNLMKTMDESADMARANQLGEGLASRLAQAPEEGMTRVALDEDLARAEAQRALKATQDSLMKGLGNDGLAELKTVVRRTKPRKEDANRFVEMPMGGSGRHPDKIYYVDKQIAYTFERLDSLFFNDQNFNRIKNVYDSITRAIKTFQTVINPAFHIRNNAGEFVMSALDMSPSALKTSYEKAFKTIMSGTEKVNISGTEYTVDNAMDLLRNISNKNSQLSFNGSITTAGELYDELIKRTSIELDGKMYTKKEILDNFEANGLRDTGVVADTFKDSLTQIKQASIGQDLIGAVAKQEAMKGKNVLSKGLRYGKSYGLGMARKASDFTDSYHRLAHYIGALDRGEGFKQASQTVKKFHVDYQDLTKTERNVMRRLVPYYTFSRKNLPMQFRAMLDRPAYPAVIGHLINNASSALGDPARPDYMENSLSIPMFETGEGNIMSLNLSLPLADLSKIKLGKDMLAEGARDMFGQLNPLLKVLPDIGSGQNIGLGIPIQDNLEYLAGNFGAVRDAYKFATSMTQDEEAESVYGRPSVIGLNRLLPIAMNNPMQTELSEAYRYRDELLEDMAERKKKGEPISQAMSPAEEYAMARGIPLRDVPKYISREKYQGDRKYQEYKRKITPRR